MCKNGTLRRLWHPLDQELRGLLTDQSPWVLVFLQLGQCRPWGLSHSLSKDVCTAETTALEDSKYLLLERAGFSTIQRDKIQVFLWKKVRQVSVQPIMKDSGP